jgi:hypothetical protein
MEKIKENITLTDDVAKEEKKIKRLERIARATKNAQEEDAISDEEAIKRATEKLDDLDLNFDDLKDKNVLDLGSHVQIVERTATIKGVGKVFSVDMRDYVMSKRPEVKNGIVADVVDGIPQIEDGSIDLLISRAGPPSKGLTSKEEVDSFIKEILRMLKIGGEARIGPLSFKFIEEKYPQYKELRRKHHKERTDDEKKEMEQYRSLVEKESLDYLKEKGLNVILEKSKNMGWSYGIIKK